jgi:hypothetical protein
MMTAGVGMYFLQQLATLIPEDASHEYAGSPALVELTVDEDKSFFSAGDAPGFRLVGRELPLDEPFEDGESSVRIFEVHLWWLINRHDFGLQLLEWLLAFFSYGWLMLIACENPVGNWASTGCGLREYVSRFVVVAQHVVQLEAVEFALQISDGLTICRHLGVNTILVLHDLSHD